MSKKVTKFILVVALFAFLGGQAFAYKYVMNDSATFSYVSATTPISTLTSGTWVDGYYDYALGDFDFYYYGRKVTHMRLSTNGYIVFGFGSATGNGVAYDNTTLPDNAVPDSMAAVNWADWDLTNGTMWYDVIGTAPNRTLVIEWRDVESVEQGTENYKFEAVFYETSNNILFQYDDVLESTSHDFGNKSTVGVEHPTSLQAELYSFNTPDLSNSQAILFTPFIHVYDSTDFDGDLAADPTVWRASDSTWYIEGVRTWTVTAEVGDIPVPGDYDGDGMAYQAMYTPSTSTWHTEIGDIAYGTEGDIPVPADYDGDGVTDIAVWRPSNGTWYIYGYRANAYGTAGDIPVPSDVDGDGSDELVIWRPADGRWYIFGWRAFSYGTAGDYPIRGDFDGGGNDDLGVWRYSDTIWYVKYMETYGTYAYTYGADGDVPVTGDFSGIGRNEIAFWRPTDGTWNIRGAVAVTYGTLADIPMLR